MRRRILLLASVPLAVPHLALAVAPQAQRRLRVVHAHTGARFDGPYHDGAAPDPVAMAELSQVLADTRTAAVRAFDPAALDILWEVGRRAGMGSEFTVLSGYRTPGTNRAVHGAGDSQHLRAGALDVQLGAGRLPAFAQAALALARGGVGTYPRRGFVHIDSGPVRRWTDGATGLLPGTPAPAQDRIGRIAEAWAAGSAPRR